ncbi:membrane protein, partial [Mycobacterium tuberculosis M1728]
NSRLPTTLNARDQPPAEVSDQRVSGLTGAVQYAALAFVGGFAVWFSLFFAMATDGCHDSACDASYHVFPAMVTMWIGVGAVLLLTLVVMVRNSSRGNVVIGWPFVGLLALGLVYVAADAVLH